jgi:aldehyde:ferredoxin oxidoreductase
MPYGLAGRNVEIDLTTGNVETTEIYPTLHQTYLGGRGISTKVFWDRVPPETQPFSEKNLLIFGTGSLTGTAAPSANRTAVITRSPQTGLLNYCTLGGFWGSELKQAGFDNMIISGKSPEPVYLWIHHGHIEIRIGKHLWGKDVKTTKSMLRAELKRKEIQIACIGPAGENRVNAASIEHGVGSGASRGGVGAVMGDKNLKAIAVYGSKDIHIARPAEFHQLCEAILTKTDKARKYWEDWPREVGAWLLGDGVAGYYDKMMPFENLIEYLEDFAVRLKVRAGTCANCAIACKTVAQSSDGNYTTVKCQSFFNFMLACKIRDLEFSLKCYDLCEAYGLDVISTASCLAFAIELFQKGILTVSDTDGIRLDWGNAEVAFAIIHKIACREGLGDVLADGVYAAARRIGKGAEDLVLHVKKLEPIPYHNFRPVSALRAAISDKPDMTRTEGFVAAEGLEFPRSFKDEYIRSGFFSYPKEMENDFLTEGVDLNTEYEKIVPFTSCDTDKNCLSDCSGLCIFWTGFWRFNPINIDDHVNLIRFALGLELDAAGAMTIAKRTNAITRAYNVITGIRRADDMVAEKYFHESPEPTQTSLDRDKFDRMISHYYELRGWTSDGIPAAEELDRLDLGYVKKALQQRGIIR